MRAWHTVTLHTAEVGNALTIPDFPSSVQRLPTAISLLERIPPKCRFPPFHLSAMSQILILAVSYSQGNPSSSLSLSHTHSQKLTIFINVQSKLPTPFLSYA